VQKWALLLPWKPMVFPLLCQKFKNVNLISVDGVINGTLEFVRRGVNNVEAFADIFATLFAIVLMRSRPTHPSFHIDPRAVFQQHFDCILVTFETGNMQRQGTRPAIDIDVS